MKAFGSPAAVAAAVRDDADAEVERIARESQAALARAAEEEAAEVPEIPGRELRLAAARREAREMLAEEDLCDAREALEAREAWLSKVVAEGRRLLDEPVPAGARRAALARLAREGLERVAGEVVVAVAPSDAALLDEAWAGALGARVVADGAIAPGGCVVRSADGRASFDDTLEARARRFEPAWRAALGALYQAAGRIA